MSTEKSTPTGGRIEWIDVAKGYGMLLVIFGHAVIVGGRWHNLIFAFHMPFFFLLSGLVYKPTTFGKLLVKRTKSLLVPYLLFFLLGAAVLGIKTAKSGFPIRALLSDFYYGYPGNTCVFSVWFLLALFFVSLLFCLILKLNRQLQYLLVLALLIGGIYYGARNVAGAAPRLPLELDVVPVALFFYAVGYYGKSLLLAAVARFQKLHPVSQILLFALLTFGYLAVVRRNGQVNLRSLLYRNPVLFLHGAFLGSAVSVLLCVWASRTFFKSALAWVGRNNVYILGAQAIGIRLCVAGINRFFGTHFGMYALPLRYAVPAFVVATLFSVLFTYAVKAVWSLRKFVKRGKPNA